MTETAQMEATQAAPAGDGGDGCFAALLAALADQLEEARQGRLEAVAETGRRVQALLDEVRRRGLDLDPDQQEQLVRLHDRVGLTLTQQQREVAEALQRLRKGRKTLRAYDRAAEA